MDTFKNELPKIPESIIKRQKIYMKKKERRTNSYNKKVAEKLEREMMKYAKSQGHINPYHPIRYVKQNLKENYQEES